MHEYNVAVPAHNLDNQLFFGKVAHFVIAFNRQTDNAVKAVLVYGCNFSAAEVLS